MRDEMKRKIRRIPNPGVYLDFDRLASIPLTAAEQTLANIAANLCVSHSASAI